MTASAVFIKIKLFHIPKWQIRCFCRRRWLDSWGRRRSWMQREHLLRKPPRPRSNKWRRASLRRVVARKQSLPLVAVASSEGMKWSRSPIRANRSGLAFGDRLQCHLHCRSIDRTLVAATIIIYTPYFQLLTVFEQSIFGKSFACNVKAYFQLLTLF